VAHSPKVSEVDNSTLTLAAVVRECRCLVGSSVKNAIAWLIFCLCNGYNPYYS